MRWRVLGVVVVMVAAGVGVGYELGRTSESPAVSVGVPTPVVAVSPAVPTILPRVATPDSDYPALPVVMHDHPAKLPNQGGYPLRMRVPDGWMRYQPDPLVPKFGFVGPDDVLNTYNMRVEIIAGSNQSCGSFLAARLTALRSAAATGVQDLDLEEDQDDGSSATLVGSYFDVGDYHRLTMQRWVALDGTSAYATVAITGRLTDRDGMAALLERTSASFQPN